MDLKKLNNSWCIPSLELFMQVSPPSSLLKENCSVMKWLLSPVPLSRAPVFVTLCSSMTALRALKLNDWSDKSQTRPEGRSSCSGLSVQPVIYLLRELHRLSCEESHRNSLNCLFCYSSIYYLPLLLASPSLLPPFLLPSLPLFIPVFIFRCEIYLALFRPAWWSGSFLCLIIVCFHLLNTGKPVKIKSKVK